MSEQKILLTRQMVTSESPAFKKHLKETIERILKRFPSIKEAAVCSVVPKALKELKILLKKFRLQTLILGEDFKVPMKNLYRNPAQVGQDRLVCSYAAKVLYGPPLLVIDFGTAITFDVVSRKGEYLGGIIVPGIRLTAESLFKKTALLPKVHIKTPAQLIGQDTKTSILSGIFYGYGSLSGGLIESIAQKTGSPLKVILTGGYSHLMKKFIPQRIHAIDRYLVFKGIRLLKQLSRRSQP